jgi:hypothetical protein
MADGTLKVGTITTSSGSGTITLGQSGETIAIPSGVTMTGMGKVLQVVNATYGTPTTTSSNVYSDTGLTASITPSSTSSKILVFVTLNGCMKATGATGIACKLVRGTTDIHNIESLATYTGGGSTQEIAIGSISTSYLDSPSSISSTSYKVQFKSFNNVAYVYINNESGGSGTSVSTMTLMEIAG